MGTGITYGSSGALEHGHLAGGALPLLRGHHGLEDLGSNVPQLLVVGAKQDDGAVGLGVEGRGDMVEQVLDDLLHAGGRDGEVLGQRVVGPAAFGELDEFLGGGGHFVFGWW